MVGKALKRFGERGRNRTYNLLIKSQLLCQLSYAPVSGFEFQPRGPADLVAGCGRLLHAAAGRMLPEPLDQLTCRQRQRI